ncbi:MAG: hypothetical protein H7259_02335 [Cytophagales bacterium]|nr:hypothetical protein [Cytophaga sp.]
MGLTIPVILNSVNNLSDARYAAGMGVDWMGFQVDEDAERYVSPDLFKAITSWIAGVETVAEVKVLNPITLAHIQQFYQPDYIQFEQIEGIEETSLEDVACFQKIIIPNGHELAFLNTVLQNRYKFIQYILLDFSEWADWRSYSTEIKEVSDSSFFWELPVEKEDISTLHDFNIQGLAIKGGNEQRPGWKDLDQMIDILEALEEH